MTTTQTKAVADRLVAAVCDADWNAVTATYAPDVLLDVNLPTWRFQLQGKDAAQYFREQTGGLAGLRTTQHQAFATERGIVIEEEMRFDGEGGEYLWRAVDIFVIDDDAVTEHRQYCTGCWGPEQIDRQLSEAPMVRW